MWRRVVAHLGKIQQKCNAPISVQVLSEFFVVVTQKITSPLSISEAYERVENYLLSWRVVDLTGMIVLEAIRGVREHQFNFWDAQIWATARLNQASLIFSEDFPTGAVIEGVKFINPFAEDFRLRDWVL